MIPNVCGCKDCGGQGFAADSRLAFRIARHGPFVLFRRGTTARQLANRVVAPSLYSALLLRSAK